MKYTILGGSGFIGNNLSSYLADKNVDLYIPKREDPEWLEKLLSFNLGTVFYCIGLTANFRNYPIETVNAHVCVLNRIINSAHMEQLIYLSSTRIYEGSPSTEESSVINIQPNSLSHLYNLSKLMGESICFNSNRKTKVIRLSNVYGSEMESENFIASVLRHAATTGKVKFQTSPSSAKDYISINDVVKVIYHLAIHGKYTIYNLASGKNTTNAEIACTLQTMGVNVEFEIDARQWSMPEINTIKLQAEFGKLRHDLIDDLPELINFYIPKE